MRMFFQDDSNQVWEVVTSLINHRTYYIRRPGKDIWLKCHETFFAHMDYMGEHN